ncbi:MAG: outer membrane beta-barrel protein [Flavobacteriia bacterium]|nr:outer membrane beta-barrel protein [Flavobacteriia bacterium]
MKGIRRIHIISCALLCTNSLLAQKKLETVTIISSRLQHALFDEDMRVDSLKIKPFASVNLSEAIRSESSVYVRSYGPGLASTVSRHGFSPSQTMVYWYGVPLNSPALGLTDLSTIPSSSTVLLDGGAGGTLYGSGYMGGGIHLEHPQVPMGWRIEEQFDYRTSGLSNNRFAISHKGEKFRHRAVLSNTWGPQDYLYTDLYGIERNRLGADQSTIHGEYYGQYTYESGLLSWGAWLSDMDRGIPRSISESYTEGARQTDDNLRAFINWNQRGSQWDLKVRLSGYYEDQRYESTVVSDTNVANASYAQTDFTWYFSDVLKLVSSLDYAYQYVRGTSKDQSEIDRIGGAAILVYKPNRTWSFSGGGRVDHQKVTTPFIPTIEAKWSDRGWSIQADYRSHFRFPTLNDLFWTPGGNPNLQPEIGNTAELLLSKSIEYQKFQMTFKGSGFAAQIENYIQWVPSGGFFEPHNVRRVSSRGASAGVEFNILLNPIKMGLSANYSYTKAIVEESERSGDPAIGNQLIYTPEHKATVGLSMNYSSWSLYADGQYYGEVHTTSDNQQVLAIEPFFNLDAGIGKQFSYKKFMVFTRVGCRNVTNTEVYFQRFYPMPGIQGTFSITIQFQSNEN